MVGRKQPEETPLLSQNSAFVVFPPHPVPRNMAIQLINYSVTQYWVIVLCDGSIRQFYAAVIA